MAAAGGAGPDRLLLPEAVGGVAGEGGEGAAFAREVVLERRSSWTLA